MTDQKKENKQYVLSVLVENHAGVLSRVSGLFSRRGYNIDSLTVCETHNSGQSRMTIVVRGDEYILEQIEKQLSKLVEVISIENCNSDNFCQRQTALIKVKAVGNNRAVIIETCNIFRAHIVDVSVESVIVEATGSENKIESLIRLLEPFGILEFAKSGLTAMSRGKEVMK
ncbi:acetolactate synthase small subunit [Treponema parvum]|uniref:Acetolactate synthase small subunit n=1 Tax=Treponema parvum TaxID=138851 RepID=A0A975F5A0_9SPIR|nr:acetolactate synthase small subunit [Treponema parvum]QTQ11582.1 acetolactate synthase small subunit [Treponema parvum]QTQ14229.1 acetolactate synthase small subunit [Treponema parvum]QTQ16468.1 acetolactate synthase small subunit [Treponema parvum]